MASFVTLLVVMAVCVLGAAVLSLPAIAFAGGRASEWVGRWRARRDGGRCRRCRMR
ncbi:hypothetical protein [Haloechinothrix sp. LS1_15]|uniref:hypothetical protein n=1 Tax=Haloechinothrix sp. LS1_15 TaxID=2652248 RepID=UPI00294B9505|nr:hypothetical protein [Haloechinothrix sp. LS1_15]